MVENIFNGFTVDVRGNIDWAGDCICTVDELGDLEAAIKFARKIKNGL